MPLDCESNPVMQSRGRLESRFIAVLFQPSDVPLVRFLRPRSSRWSTRQHCRFANIAVLRSPESRTSSYLIQDNGGFSRVRTV